MDKKEVRIVYLGTPELSAQLLERLLLEGYRIVGVVTQPDAPKGRGGKKSPSPVGEVALKYNIPLHRPMKLNKDFSFIEDLKPDLLLTYAYGQILSSKVLSLSSRFPPLNVHASLLPKLRGASPIQTALMEGDDKTGVCLMEMVKAMDAGRIFAKDEIEIPKEMNFTELEERISQCAIDLALSKLPLYFEGKLAGEPQEESQATFCHYITKEDMELDLSYSPKKFIDMARAFSLKPGAFLRIKDGEPLKVLQAKDYHGDGARYGIIKALDKHTLVLGLRDGNVELTLVQKPGKKPCDGASFINGLGVGHAMIVLEKEHESNG